MAESKLLAAYNEAEASEQGGPPSAGVAAAVGVAPVATAWPHVETEPGDALGSLACAAVSASADIDAVAPQVSPDPDPFTRRPRVLLAVSGSVATVKVIQLAEALLRFADVRVLATKSSLHFFDAAALPPPCGSLLGDDDEWRQWRQVGDPVVHIELRRWADALVVAPLSANTLAKVANGLCDNLLTCVVRAWDFGKPLLAAPAMNTFMWQSPFTPRHLEACRQLGVRVVAPVSKKLACGDVGDGAMAGVEDVAGACREALRAVGFRGLAEERVPASGLAAAPI